MGLEFGELFLRNYTGKRKADDVSQIGELADYVCYRLMKRGDAVVRKNLEVKNKKKMINNVYFYTVANICKGEQKDLRKGGGNIIFDVKYRPLR